MAIRIHAKAAGIDGVDRRVSTQQASARFFDGSHRVVASALLEQHRAREQTESRADPNNIFSPLPVRIGGCNLIDGVQRRLQSLGFPVDSTFHKHPRD